MHGFRVRFRRLPHAATVTAITLANSALGLLQTALFSARLSAVAVEPDPIFIVGHYRSGTTLLHNLLALDERLSYPTMFECSAPHHCLLTGRVHPKLFTWLLPPKRVMDDMDLGFDLPQEDELALIALGMPSPYWSLAFPGESAGQRFMALGAVSESEREAWEQTFMGFLRLVSLRRPGRPLVLKSPPHTARIAMLTRIFPRARFLHIVRDPFEVFASTVRLWRRSRAQNALAKWDENAVEREILEGLPEMYRDFDAACSAVPAGQFHQLRYEDLAQNPLGTLSVCYRRIGLGDFELARPCVERYLSSVRGHRRNEYQISPDCRAAVRTAWSSFFVRWGYEMP
jgi:hypothetical protein